MKTLTSFLAASVATLLPLALIWLVLRPADLMSIPRTMNPNAEAYANGIERISGASDNLITIALAILAATVIWFFKDKRAGLVRQLLIYTAFVFSIASLYFGTKIGYWAGITLASGEPDIVPLLSSLRWQALTALAAGLLLTGVAVFSTLASKRK